MFEDPSNEASPVDETTDATGIVDDPSNESTAAVEQPDEVAESAEDAPAAENQSGSGGRRWITWVLGALVVVVLAAVVVMGFMVYRILPQQGEAPRTAAQAAINTAKAGVQAKPKDVLARLTLADAYYQHRLYPDALKTLDGARSLEPTGPMEAYLEVGYGRVYEAMGDKSAAEKHYLASAKLLETLDALYLLGNLAVARGDDTAAVEYWLRALKITPEAATLRIDVARIYEKQKKYDLALQQLEEAARYLGDDAEVNAEIARVKPLAQQSTPKP